MTHQNSPNQSRSTSLLSLAATLAALALGGCSGDEVGAAGSSSPPPAPDDGTGTDDGAGGSGGAIEVSEPEPESDPPPACQGVEIATSQVPPNLLVVLDRSCSMQQQVADETKWSVAALSVLSLVQASAAQIRFGLTLFPDAGGQSCKQGAIPIPVADDAGSAILDLLGAALDDSHALHPSAGPCDTNLDTAMEQAAGEASFAALDRASFVLLFTDGKQNDCSEAGGIEGAEKIVRKLRKDSGVRTFVIGFDQGIDAEAMNELADAGGVPASADPATRYWAAADPATMGAIASRARGCTLHLETAPADANELYVFHDDVTPGIARDPAHQEGWDYDAAANAITFYGAACAALEEQQVKDIDVVAGCDAPTDS